MLEEQFFDPKAHDRQGFHCGEPALDEFISKYAGQQSAHGVTSVFVLVDDTKPSKILGFYTLSAAQVNRSELSLSHQKRLPRYPIPCFRLGRLARDLESQGTGIGEILIGLAVDRCRKARLSVAAYALLVDAKNPAAKSFYQKYGFMPCADSPMLL
ncbi:MAG: GNAT family N-acetyltransferase, partial [Rhodoferax sp.]|nr:GNAT family N-acetyltransferase [Rhodoferax sp.]